MTRFLSYLTSRAPLHRDAGLFLLRAVVGLSMLVFHGWSKITAGPERWEGLGGQMANLGIDFAPVFWGFMAAFAESVGSVLLVLGIFFRPAAGLLAITMLVAVVRHVSLPADAPGAGWGGGSHALELLGVYVALLLMGSGRWRLGRGGTSSDEPGGSR